ncbi:hypothetical protein DID88_009885 [Monilinia fructigena]|uniref:Uncharacterized protein n=1 Tax=Monilinia fructigena TaxID=38457 RepID=A0A395IKI1_9HELO|nr:hypothetical protein DID88_009885 [Monilinia fructigena]
MTPRKPRQRQNHPGPSQLNQVQVSDYDTETPIPPLEPVRRLREDVNLEVLRRYHPSIQMIKSIAGSATMYMFSLESKNMGETSYRRNIVLVLNRKGLNNVIYDLSEMNNVEINGEYLYWTVEKPEIVGGTPVAKAFGIFIHDDESGTRAINQSEILNNWKKTQATMTDVQTLEHKVENYGEKGPREEITYPGQIQTQTEAQGGRRLSITDLFGGR